jgi:hypothetical protein
MNDQLWPALLLIVKVRAANQGHSSKPIEVANDRTFSEPNQFNPRLAEGQVSDKRVRSHLESCWNNDRKSYARYFMDFVSKQVDEHKTPKRPWQQERSK